MATKKKGMFSSWLEIIKMWDDIYDEYLNKYSPEREVASRRNLYMDSNFAYSGISKATAYYIVEKLPPEMELGYRKTFRSVVPLGVAMNFIEVNTPFEVNWSDPAFKSRMSIMDSVSREREMERAGASEYSAHEHQHDLDKEELMKDSISYVRTVDMSKDNRRKLTQVRVLIIITGQRGVDFSTCLKDFESYCEKRTGLQVARVIGTISQVMQDFSPMSNSMTERARKIYPSTFTSDELKARWHPYEQGIVGYGRTYIGTNIDTNSPVFKTFKRDSTDAEIVLILGTTGSGKSYLMKTIATQLAGEPHMVMTINDYEGGEYRQLGALVAEEGSVVELDFSKGSGRYYDPVPLIPTGDPEIDVSLLETARANLIALFRAVAGEEILRKHEWIRMIIENGVDKFYNDLGVSNDTHTWYPTLAKSIYDVYNAMLTYRPEEDVVLNRFALERALFVEMFSPYFDKNKKINNYFTDAVTLADIRSADLVICNYNMRGVSEDKLSELDSILIPLNASIISYYRTIFPKADGKYNVKIWEELQRFKKLKGAVELLKTPLSGGRKMGDINIVGSNDPAELLVSDDFNLFGSYTMALVGKVQSSTTRELICKTLDLNDLRDELDAISTLIEENDGIEVSHDEVNVSPYRKAFIARLDTGESVVLKADIPKWLSNTSLFRTGVDVKEEN